MQKIDFKRHKDVVAYFNKEYVANNIFPREIGRRLGILKQLREKSDYDDFYIASKEQAEKQIETAAAILKEITSYWKSNIQHFSKKGKSMQVGISSSFTVCKE